MDLYSLLAQWTGWPPIVAGLLLVGIIGSVMFAQRDALRTVEISVLKEKAKRLEELSPDVLVSRLQQRKQLLEEELAKTSEDDAVSRAEIQRLNRELQSTQSEANSLQYELQRAQDSLTDLIYPRAGKVKQALATDILSTVTEQQAIFVAVRLGSTILGEASLQDVQQAAAQPISVVVRVLTPGMNKMYVGLTSTDHIFLGQIDNPYVDSYEHDYYETLLAILPYLPHEELPIRQEAEPFEGGDLSVAIKLSGATFQGVSPIDATRGYYRLPFTANGDVILRAIYDKYGYSNNWYTP